MAAVEARKQPQQSQGQNAAEGALPSGLKMEEASVLMQPGTKDGDTKIVKEGGAGVAYTWDAARWVCVQVPTVNCSCHVVPWVGLFHAGLQWASVYIWSADTGCTGTASAEKAQLY